MERTLTICGEGVVKDPVHGAALITHRVEASGFGVVGEWLELECGDDSRLREMLHRYNAHPALVACREALRRALEFAKRVRTDEKPSENAGVCAHADHVIAESRAAIAATEGQ